MKKIIDCFIFYNEIELLTYRLNILENLVDFFVIVESTHTFVGKQKPLYFNENKHLFKKFDEKIIHIIIDDFPFKHPQINFQNNEQWKNEYYQRNSIKKGIELVDNINDNDIIIISDLDEIPDPKTLFLIKENKISIEINSLLMDFYYYNLNTRFSSKWILSKILTYKKYKNLNTDCNTIRNLKCVEIPYGGWHLSYFGNNNFIKNKIENFSHQEFNNDFYTNLTSIENKINNKKDLFNRNEQLKNIPVNDNDYLPPKYQTYLKNFFT